MKSETLLPKNSLLLKDIEYESLFKKKSLKGKNLTFTRNWSSKNEKHIKQKKIESECFILETGYQHIFVPKLKSKELLRSPKFFFSLERKKIKKEISEPSFEEIKCNNPELKGSKTKTFYTKCYNSRKISSPEIINDSQTPYSPHKEENDKTFIYSSKALRIKHIPEKDQITRNFSYTSENENIDSKKTLKRPNLNENISFLIRRKREIKNKTTLDKIKESKHKMEHFFTNFQSNNP